uniref:Uncharacterized protein n=1 Tax=Panagrolaimus sp. JU765 TaxID=591449 RepID=A0AC34RT67_9BILA
MSRFILWSSLLIIAFSGVFSSNSEEENEKCEDRVHNFITAQSPRDKREIADYPAKITKLTGSVYDADAKPACHQKRPSVFLPGYLKLIDGQLHVNQDFDLVKDGYMRLTVSGADFDDPPCKNGTSTLFALPDDYCRLNLCNFIGVEMCKILQTKGVHTLDELETKLGFNRTLKLPEPPSILGISLLDFFSGEFKFGFAIETEGRTILEVIVPTNDKYLQIGVE